MRHPGTVHRVPAFDVADPVALLAELLGTTPATLVTRGADGLTSTILPLLLEPGGHDGLGTLVGHVARGNPVVRDGHGGEALVVVTGVEGYVSPSWYPSKAEHGRAVPTWDYVTVEAAGSLVLHDDPAWLLHLVTRLTERHEAARAAPWAVADAPDGFIAAQLRGIVGVEVPIARLAAKAKLSQNRPAADVAGVVAGLRAEAAARPGTVVAPADALADAVERAAPPPGHPARSSE